MQEPSEQTTSQAPASKGWLVDQIERNANAAARLAVIQERNALFTARHDRIHKRMSTAFITAFTATAMFGLFMGCVAIWNAVVG